ncbi:MAG: dehydrogenase E1 component subunit alpha/beta [Saprospiraceae bacterium]|nr:dehydrogenase E1 component subunit alpha/beta [Saprospiraceae bacterium]
MEQVTRSTAIKYNKKRLSKKKLLELYKAILKPRMVEEKMLVLLRQGRISKWFAGIGQEAIAVGVTSALEMDEYIFTMHRNLGVFTTRQVPLHRLFCQWQGKMPGFTKGRDRSFHFGAPEHNIVGMISHLGPQLSFAGGVGLANKIGGEAKVAVAFTGEGGTSEGDFHEALNVAAVWKLPVIFVIENNGYGLSTPTDEQYACKDLVDRAVGYGMKGLKIDGNNILEVYDTIKKVAKDIRKNPQPVLIECKTFRMRGHEEASGTKYVPKELMDTWAEKDPVKNFEAYLLEEGVLTEEMILDIRKSYKQEIESGLQVAYAEPDVNSSIDYELNDVYAPHEVVETTPSTTTKEIRFVDAISEGLHEAMLRHPKLVLMGQDIAEYGGVFKITQGFVEEFGHDRVRNTPLCESAIMGMGLGLSLSGYKAMMEMQFADFATCGFNQIVNNAAKLHYRWGQNVDMVIRMPTGGGVGAGPFHSQSNEAWFFHTPGLKIVYPSNPYDAKGLLLASFEDPNPVMFFEHKALYRSMSGEVPEGYYTVEIGKAKVVQEGTEATILAYGNAVHWATKLVEELGVDVEVVDLRTLLPLDYETIGASVAKTNRVLVVHEDTLTGGIGADLSAYISEHHFEDLDAPVLRAAALDSPFPFAGALEKNFLPHDRMREQLIKLLEY